MMDKTFLAPGQDGYEDRPDDCGFRADNAALVLVGIAALSYAYHKRDKILPVIDAGFDAIFDKFLPPRTNK